jgi:Fuc2NAc and GlcNAc transferase
LSLCGIYSADVVAHCDHAGYVLAEVMYHMLQLLFSVSLVFGASGAAAMAYAGARLGLTDVANGRSSHVGVVPRGGGIGIAAGAILMALSMRLPWLALLSLVVIALVGLADDRWRLSPLLRLTLQTGAAVLACLGLMLPVAWLLWAIPLVVGTTNVYNFMDGVNGMAGLTGLVAFGLMAGLCSLLGNQQLALLCVGVAAACLGFLPWNLRRHAAVFMGDVGSTTLGFSFAVVMVALAKSQPATLSLSPLLLAPFYGDALLTFARRAVHHERLSDAHRSHAYQRLANELGWAHVWVSCVYAAAEAIIGALVLALLGRHGLAIPGLWIIVIVALATVWAMIQLHAYRSAAS